MRLPIYIETKGPDGQHCGNNCPFLHTGVDGGLCILFSEELVDMGTRRDYNPEYNRLSKCAVFDDGE